MKGNKSFTKKEEMSRQPFVDDIKWVFWRAFRQLSTENQEQTAQMSDFKSFEIHQKWSSYKVMSCIVLVQESLVTENNSPQKKPSILHQDNRKDALKWS